MGKKRKTNHRIQHGFRMMNYCAPAIRLEEFEITIRNIAVYFEDGVAVRVETSHLRMPNELVPCAEIEKR